MAAGALASGWNVYAANVLPLDPAALTLADGSKAAFVPGSLTTDVSYAKLVNGVLEVDTRAADAAVHSQFRLNNAFRKDGVYPKTATLVARIKGSGVDGLRSLYLDMALGDEGGYGARIQTGLMADRSVRVFELDQSKATPAEQGAVSGPVAVDVWHVYQIAVTLSSATAGTVKVYLDGADTPIIDKTLTNLRQVTNPGDNFIAFGEGSTSASARGSLDWLIWSNDAAYTSAEVSGKLPAGLSTEHWSLTSGWSGYNAKLHPTAANAVDLDGGSKTGFVVTDASDSTLTTVSDGRMLTDTTAADVSVQSQFRLNNVFRNDGVYPKRATVIARVRADNGAPVDQTTMYLDMAMADFGASGPRFHAAVMSPADEYGIIFHTLDLARPELLRAVTAGKIATNQWRVFHIAINLDSPTAGSLKVYLDGAATPILDRSITSLRQVEGLGDNFLSIGEKSTTRSGKGWLDWVIWSNQGAFTPDEVRAVLP